MLAMCRQANAIQFKRVARDTLACSTPFPAEGAGDGTAALVAHGTPGAQQALPLQVSLPTETATKTCFLELYIASILALQQASGARKPLPLAIMTSDDTHDATLKLLQDNAYFGAKPSQVLRRVGTPMCVCTATLCL